MANCCVMGMMGQGVETFVSSQLKRYPKSRLLDLYKSCFQDYMGAEHLVGDTTAARSYLEQELETTELDSLLPWLVEPCGFHERYVRVSLRTVLEGKIPADVLLDAFIASANDPDRPTQAQWRERWRDIIAVIDSIAPDLPCYQEDKRFINEVLAQGRYAISHSPDYRNAYSPHYRIVRSDIYEQRILPLLLMGNGHCY
ncbi:MAG: hypothetical protein IJV05_02595 [Muribaculaceae bacterium]|nr:hypothetical protein [Muribaculaceae bacterium]